MKTVQDNEEANGSTAIDVKLQQPYINPNNINEYERTKQEKEREKTLFDKVRELKRLH